MRCKSLVPLAVTLLMLVIINPHIGAEEGPRVLYLNSYHQGNEWSDRIYASFVATLTERADVHVEYLDTKRFLDEGHQRRLIAFLNEKYAETPLDLIVAADDAAYQTVIEGGLEQSRRVPILFCGVNEYDPTEIPEELAITGVAELLSLEDSLDLIFSLHPRTDTLLVVTDNTLNGVANAERIRRYASSQGALETFRFANANGDLTLASLAQLVAELPNSTTVYYSDFHVEPDGTEVTPAETIDALGGGFRFPIYAGSNVYLGKGAIGGKMVTPEQQGTLAAAFANRILSGEEPSEIPVVDRSIAQYMFDARFLRIHGVSRADLPPESTVINTLLDRLSESKELLFVSLGVILLLLVVLGAVVWNSRVRAQAAKALEWERHLFHTLMDQFPEPIYFKDRSGRFMRVNQGYARFVRAANPKELEGKNDEELFPRAFAATQRELEKRIMETRTGVEDNLEEVPDAEGGTRWVQATKLPLIGPEGAVRGVFGVSRDITDEVKAKEHLRRLLREREMLLREVHHRTKNNMQLIVSMLSLQERTVGDPTVTEALKETRSRIYSMAIVHEHLYKSANVAELKLGSYLEAIMNNALEFRRPGLEVRGEMQGEECPVDLEEALPLGLIVNELVTNAVKHAFPGRSEGAVKLTVERRNGEITMEIRDDGVGLPTEFPQLQRSMGMRIVTGLVEQIEGTLAVSSASGTTFTIAIPRNGEES